LGLILLFTLTSVLEALGIGLIGPFLGLASNPESISEIYFLNWLYEKLALQSKSQFIFLLGLVIIVLFCMKSLSYFLAKTYIFRFSFNQKGKICSRLLKAYLEAPYTFFLKKNTSRLIQNIIIETQKFCDGCMLPFLDTISNFIVVLILLSLLAKTNVLFLVMVSAILIPVFLIFHRLKNRLVKWGREGSESQTEMIRIINHGLGGFKDTRIIGCEAYFEKQLEHQVNIHENAATSLYTSQALPRIIIEALLIIFVVFFVSISQFVSRGEQDITPVLGVFAIASIRLLPSASQLVSGMNILQNTSYVLDMLYFDLKEIEQEKLEKNILLNQSLSIGNSLDDKHFPSRTMPFMEQVELKNISYTYPDTSKPAIENISLILRKGQSIAFIGKSGAGKTTLVDVILGLLMPEKGDILVDGISTYPNIRGWQNLIGYIPQSIYLMDDTVESNIAFGVPDHLINLERLDKAIRAAQLTELIEELPDGIKTVVGERGIRLSGGQRQRIGIARSLYHEREILVLDEATSALDNETESLVTEAIRSLSGQKTIIIIAHRLTTVEHCDCVYLLEKGRIVQSGSYREVVVGDKVNNFVEKVDEDNLYSE
jgi:ABC-type multidrug transport system fused ATPase/permease subunit